MREICLIFHQLVINLLWMQISQEILQHKTNSIILYNSYRFLGFHRLISQPFRHRKLMLQLLIRKIQSLPVTCVNCHAQEITCPAIFKIRQNLIQGMVQICLSLKPLQHSHTILILVKKLLCRKKWFLVRILGGCNRLKVIKA